MHILIDNQKSVEVTPTTLTDRDGHETEVLSFTDAHMVLETWHELDLAHRDYRYGNDDSDTEPCQIHIAWVDGTGALAMNTVDPYWDDLNGTVNGYALVALEEVLPEGAVKWGAALGEPTA